MNCPTLKCKGIVEVKKYHGHPFLKCTECSFAFSEVSDEKTIKYFEDHGGIVDEK